MTPRIFGVINAIHSGYAWVTLHIGDGYYDTRCLEHVTSEAELEAGDEFEVLVTDGTVELRRLEPRKLSEAEVNQILNETFHLQF